MTTTMLTSPAPTSHWRRAAGMLLVLVLVQLLLQWPLAHDMGQIWWHSKTFNHCVVIPAISAWLIYQRRAAWLTLTPTPSYAGVIVVLVANLLLLLANLAGIALVGHFALVLSVQALIWAVCGSAVCKQLLFPLLYLWFAVPFGEFLVPRLQDVTADMAVALLRLFDIPVFRDGHFIALPNGDFLVEEACSGISYLIASLALGTLYAYLQYRSYWRRSLFIMLSIVVPIVANGVRAFGIILTAHLTNNEYAVGVDHLIYGWIFFGVVMFLLFLLGRTFADGGPLIEQVNPDARTDGSRAPAWPWQHALAALLVIGLTAGLGQRVSVPAAAELGHIPLPTGWNLRQQDEIGAQIEGASSQQIYHDGSIQVLAAYFPQDQIGHELVNSYHRLYNNVYWRQLQTETHAILGVHSTGMRLNNGFALTVISHRLYLFSDRWVGAGWQAKWHQLQARLQQRPAPALLLLISRPQAMSDAELEQRVQPLLQALQAQLASAEAAAP